MFVVALHLALDPLVTWHARRTLDSLEGYDATFENVDLDLYSLSYTIERLRLTKKARRRADEPYVQVARMKTGVSFRELLGARLVADVEIDRARVNLVSARRAEQLEPEDPDIARKLGKLLPFRMNRLVVRDGEIRWKDEREKELPVIRLHALDARVENLATRTPLAKGEPTTLTLRGRVQESGRLEAHVQADPLEKQLTFEGRAELIGLRARELGRLSKSKSDVRPKGGTIDVFVEFRARDGRLSGGVKPILKDVELESGTGGLMPKLKALLADKTLDLFERERGGRDVAATVIPIQGRVRDPQAQLWPTVLGIIRNAFVEAFVAGFANLPPEEQQKGEGFFDQLRRTFDEDAPPPKAEPQKK